MVHNWAQAHRNSQAVFATVVLSIGFLVLMPTVNKLHETLSPLTY